MSELRVISEDLKLKVMQCAVRILFMHGSVAGDRCCQDWSGADGENPDVFFTKEEKDYLSFNYEQWNSNGEDYDPDRDSMHDEMVASFAIACALKSIAEPQAPKPLSIRADASPELLAEMDELFDRFASGTGDMVLLESQSDWIDVGEFKPTEDCLVHAYCNDIVNGWVETLKVDTTLGADRYYFTKTNGDDYPAIVTHVMPITLPTAPKGE